jgi:hypothetical protein
VVLRVFPPCSKRFCKVVYIFVVCSSLIEVRSPGLETPKNYETFTSLDRWDSEVGCSFNTVSTTIFQIRKPTLASSYSCKASVSSFSFHFPTVLQVLCLLDDNHSWCLLNLLCSPHVVQAPTVVSGHASYLGLRDLSAMDRRSRASQRSHPIAARQGSMFRHRLLRTHPVVLRCVTLIFYLSDPFLTHYLSITAIAVIEVFVPDCCTVNCIVLNSPPLSLQINIDCRYGGTSVARLADYTRIPATRRRNAQLITKVPDARILRVDKLIYINYLNTPPWSGCLSL